MCERKGQDADMCPYQMHCPKRCISCGDASTAVCLNPLPKKPEEDTERPCRSCAIPSCENCPISPMSNALKKLYTPEEAVKAMLAGKTLRNEKGWGFYWDNNKSFRFRDDEGELYTVGDFSGLYSDAPHA